MGGIQAPTPHHSVSVALETISETEEYYGLPPAHGVTSCASSPAPTTAPITHQVTLDLSNVAPGGTSANLREVVASDLL